MGEYPLQPEECVTSYAKINLSEDIAESVVAYIYDQELLRSISPRKYEILRGLDRNLQAIEAALRRIEGDEKGIPVPEPETIKYYIVEPGKED